MSAGLPGFGLGGLFFVICALLAPGVELVRTARGRSSLAAWGRTGRQFALAATMVAVFEAWRRGLAALGFGVGALDLRGVAVTAAILVAVLAGAKALQLGAACVRASRRLNRRRSARAARRRVPEPGRYSPAAHLAPDPEG
jgi:hypothetical protein